VLLPYTHVNNASINPGMRNYSPIRLFIADDHEIYLLGLVQMLRTASNIDIVGTSSRRQELPGLFNTLYPDVLLTNPTFILNKDMYQVNMIVFSDNTSLFENMLHAGVLGFLPRKCDKQEVLEAIRQVHDNNPYFSPAFASHAVQTFARKTNPEKFSVREKQIIQLVCEDLSTKEIAAKLLLSSRTVEGYRMKIMEKMRVRGTAGIVLNALRQHIITI
jgi:DNA-binding NarL/FixJ family response regulator